MVRHGTLKTKGRANMEELLKRITNSHAALQAMNVPAVKENLAILLDTLETLEQCFSFVNAQKAKEAENKTEGGADNA